jgi:SNF2 family DNA or RNA helicase
MAQDMNDLLKLATLSLKHFLEAELPKLSQDWWQGQVKSKLSYQQQRMVEEKRITKLEQLDLAALLRVLDQNWFDLQGSLGLPFEGRNWVKEMQSVRNKWAHLSAEKPANSEIYRDADTLARMLGMLDADANTREKVETFKQEILSAMTPPKESPIQEVKKAAETTVSELTEPTMKTLFKPGDLAILRSDVTVRMPVMEVLTGGAETRYKVFHGGQIVSYYESQLQTPEEATAGTCLDVAALHAYLTSLQLLSPSTSNLFSLHSGRINFVPYQYRPVLKMIRADRPRLLIADEVGVGKTIEAGLIIKELRARMDIQSVLIICPKALVAERKWELEMKRFDEQFTPLDGTLLRHCIKETHLDGEWPDQYAKAILPFSLFDSVLLHGVPGKGHNRRLGLLELDPPPKFDLVIVDEAHHLRNSDTYLHQAVRYFCDNAQASVFLTATPVQLGNNDLYTLMNVLRPDLIIDQASFERMAEPNALINKTVHLTRTRSDDWQQKAREHMDQVAQTEWGRVFLRETPTFQKICDQLGEDKLDDVARIKLIYAMEELYTFSSLINRTRRRDIGNFTTRKPQTLTIPFTEDQQLLHDDLLNLSARILAFCHGQQNVKFMMTTLRRQAASCLYGLAPFLQNILNGNLEKIIESEVGEGYDRESELDLTFVNEVRAEIKQLVDHADSLDPHDPKVEAFVKVLQDKAKMSRNKALVFSTFRHTLSYLVRHVEPTGLRYGLIHGSVPDGERSLLRHRFSLPQQDPEALDVLLSSEVGCEGLDFQFCDLLLNYDLPWNPMRVEQRIGRIDRYGQKSQTVAIINLITPGTVDADIYQRCLWRIGVFHNAIGGSEEILGELSQQIQDIGESFELSPEEREARLSQLADNEIRQVQEEDALEEKQAQLFGLNVPRKTWEKDIEEAESFWLSPKAIQQCVTIYLTDRAAGGVGHLMGDKPLKTLRLSQEVRSQLLTDMKGLRKSTDPAFRQWEKWLKGSNPNLPVTFDQDVASDQPDAAFLNVLHPLVRQAARNLERTDAVHVDIQVTSDRIPEGRHPFAIYRWKMLGVKQDEVLEPIAFDPEIESAILNLIPLAVDSPLFLQISSTVLDELDARHHMKWRAAQTNHISENMALIEQRVQSLGISHRARCSLLNDQIAAATNDKIQLMKQSELGRANADFQRCKDELDQAARSADVHAAPVVVGFITNKNKVNT